MFPRWSTLLVAAALAAGEGRIRAADPLAPVAPPDWSVEILLAHPQIRYPSAITCSPDGRLFIAEDPIDMDGPRDQPIDRVLCRHPDGRLTVFATNLYCVFGLLYLDGRLYVNHTPKLSVFEDGGDAGRNREDWFDYTSPRANGTLLTGAGTHIQANLRWGMDGFIYMAVGDTGLFGTTDRAGKKVDYRGGGLARFRPDGTGLEIVSSGTRNHPDVALNAQDEGFTYDNTDDGLGWWTRVTHMVDRGYYGYPWDYRPRRPYTLWMMLDYGSGSGTCALAYNEDALPAEYEGNVWFGEFARQQMLRLKLRPEGATYAVAERVQTAGRDFLVPGGSEFRPTGMTMSPDGASFYIADWNSNFAGVIAPIGRILKVTYTGTRRGQPRPPWWVPAATGKPFQADARALAEGLKHPAQSVRLVAQRRLAERGAEALPAVLPLLTNRAETFLTRASALWTLDALDAGKSARAAIVSLVDDPDAALRAQAARHLGTRAVIEATAPLTARLKDENAKVRFHAATALGRIAEPAAVPALLNALTDADAFSRYAAFTALNFVGRAHPASWKDIAAALKSPEPRVREGAQFALRETWDTALIETLAASLASAGLDAATRATVVQLLGDAARQEAPWDGSWWGVGSNPAARPRPARTRDWAGTSDALTALREALQDKEPAVRTAALSAIRQVRDTNAAPALRALLASETDPARAKEALSVLGEVGGSAFVEELRQLVDTALSGKSSPRLDALLPAALTVIQDNAATPQLLRLTQGAARIEWRVAAIEALGRSHDPAAGPALQGLLAVKQPAVARAAVEALALVDPVTLQREAPRLLKDSRLDVRRAVVRALASIPDPAAVEPLHDGLKDAALRDDIIKVFAARPDMSAFNAYVSGLSSADAPTVEASVNALITIQGESLPRLETLPTFASLPMPVLQRLAGMSRNHPFQQMLVLGPIFDGPLDYNGLVQAAATSKPYAFTASWQQAQGRPLTGRVPLRELLKLTKANPAQVAYAMLPITIPSPQQIILSVEAGDLRALMLNGQDILGSTYPAENGPRRFREFATTLPAGQNLLLAAVGLSSDAPVFSLSRTLHAPQPKAADATPEAYAAFATNTHGQETSGLTLFHDSRKAACARCHRAGGFGVSLGPALDGVGTKLTRGQIIEALLYPSKQILHGFQQVSVTRKNGETISGLLVREDAVGLSLVDSTGKTNALKTAEIAERKASQISMMPEGLHAGMSPQEFADLVAYLQGLK